MPHQVSQKAQYALRVLFELAKRRGTGPIKIETLARAQSIPTRFLEVILAQLKKAGFVRSRRGQEGGYELARSPEAISAGDVLRFVDGSLTPIGTLETSPRSRPSARDIPFLEMWKAAYSALTQVYDQATLSSLMAQEEKRLEKDGPSYSI